ncbi:hypothetical protein FHS55_003147 [Angulomicrobium tetraedrale]|uniref:Tyr recombinase domain-containing protein n=1 Tax=Ancylobacter tetraedralis TaxID=217068 RepID=A0A839ZCX8_9HYPH|nr:hypothetical protein [Ancylobacter tetraedralis]
MLDERNRLIRQQRVDPVGDSHEQSLEQAGRHPLRRLPVDSGEDRLGGAVHGPKATRHPAEADAERAPAMLQNAGRKPVTSAMLSKFASVSRQRIRLEGAGYRRDHLRALAQRVEFVEGEVRISGSKCQTSRSVADAFIVSLQDSDGVTARALEFLILTAARSGEVREAQWGEFDLKAKVWTVPAHRMKAGREHRVPLPARTIELLTGMKPPDCDDSDSDAFVFPGARKAKPLSVMAFDMQLRRLDCDYTVHGFRSAFRDWVGEETTFQREVAEAALAHTVGDEVERAYRRGDALEKRRTLMEAWAMYCEHGDDEADANRASSSGEERSDVTEFSGEPGEQGVQV